MDAFIDSVVNKSAFSFPHTFDRAKALITAAGQDPKDCMELRMAELQIHYMEHMKLCKISLAALHGCVDDQNVSPEMERRGYAMLCG